MTVAVLSYSRAGVGGTASGESIWHSTTSVLALSATGRATTASIILTSGCVLVPPHPHLELCHTYTQLYS